MEIIEADTLPFLTNFEVHTHLATTNSHPTRRRPPQSVQTISFEVLDYLKGQRCSRLTEAKLAGLCEWLSRFKLMKAERLQMINLLPESAVEFHVCVEECEERFEQGQIDEILAGMQSILNERSC